MTRTFRIINLGLIIWLFTIGATKAQDNCIILHKGTFKYADTPEEIIVKIKGTKHTEYHNNGKYIIESDINWVNDCEYNMTMTKITIPDFPYGPGDVMNVKIEKVIENEIYYVSTVKGQSWKGKFIKVKDK
jgi:hypothetical protein